MKSFSGFYEFVRQDEGVFSAIGGVFSAIGGVFSAIGGVFNKITKAIRTAAWAVRHPAQVPPEIAHAVKDEWTDLVKKYGYTEATIIFASLVVALGPGLMIPGSMLLFWVALGACKLFNFVVGKMPPREGKQMLSQEQVDKEAEAIKDRLLEVAKKVRQKPEIIGHEAI